MGKTAEKPADEPEGKGPEAPALVLAPEPLMQGLAAIKAEDPDALRIWSVKGPKTGGGTISRVLMPDTNRVVVIHQRPSGKYTIYEARRPAVETE